MREKSKEEHKFTSTGIKFWRHQEQMFNYKHGYPNTIISTHIAPEGVCNLKCPYCSVTYRDTHERIDLEVIKQYVRDLKTRGLKAVIITGGGEPTTYKYFNELVRFIHDEEELKVALINNGTLTRKIKDDVLKMFSWVRVSVNMFDRWEERIKFPYHKLSDDCVVGCSSVFTTAHEKSEDTENKIEMYKKISKVADNCGAEYIRLLPDCLLEQDKLIEKHYELDEVLLEVNDTRYFHQYKVHGAPQTSKCHQSYFRPYLSEVNGGTVFPCDSVVLNGAVAHFSEQYALCKAEDVLEYIDGRIKQPFDAQEHCKGCVFTENVNMLDDFINNKLNKFEEFSSPLDHEEFV